MTTCRHVSLHVHPYVLMILSWYRIIAAIERTVILVFGAPLAALGHNVCQRREARLGRRIQLPRVHLVSKRDEVTDDVNVSILDG